MTLGFRRRLVAAQTGGGECQQGSQTLAASRDKMGAKLRNERDRALHPRDDGTVAGLHVLFQVGGQSGKGALAPCIPDHSFLNGRRNVRCGRIQGSLLQFPQRTRRLAQDRTGTI